MKKLLLSTILGLALLSLVGCNEKEGTKSKTETTETAVMKCEASKCGDAMEKAETPPAKPDADGKCGDK